MKNSLKLIVVALILSFNSCSDNSTNPSNSDDTVTIGTQVWMKKNLDVDHYRNGDSIPQVKDSAQWVNLTTGAWCYYNNSDSLGAIYGKLYNWYAVNDPRGLTPAGWHVPSDSEWTVLSNFYGGDSLSGGKLKESDTTHWYLPNNGATNESGFTALPGGYRYYGGFYFNVRNYGYWWSSTESYASNAWFRYLSYGSANMFRVYDNKGSGFSVRLVRD